MHRSIVTALVAFSMIGCAAATPTASAPTPEHLRTDNDRYLAAYTEAFVAYEREVVIATSEIYDTAEEAAVVQRSHSARRFEGLFAESLNRRGLTVRGFEVHRSHHPELAELIGAQYGARGLELNRAATSIGERFDPAGGQAILFDRPAPEQLASR